MIHFVYLAQWKDSCAVEKIICIVIFSIICQFQCCFLKFTPRRWNLVLIVESEQNPASPYRKPARPKADETPSVPRSVLVQKRKGSFCARYLAITRNAAQSVVPSSQHFFAKQVSRKTLKARPGNKCSAIPCASRSTTPAIQLSGGKNATNDDSNAWSGLWTNF